MTSEFPRHDPALPAAYRELCIELFRAIAADDPSGRHAVITHHLAELIELAAELPPADRIQALRTATAEILVDARELPPMPAEGDRAAAYRRQAERHFQKIASAGAKVIAERLSEVLPQQALAKSALHNAILEWWNSKREARRSSVGK